MSAEFEAQTRTDDLERELRDVTEAGLVVVPEMRSEVGEKKGRPHAVLPAVLVVALIAAACSGPPARAGESPTVPEVTATEAAAIPGMQDQVRIPAIGSEVTPSPSVSPVETAIKEGKIEVKGPQEWGKYFVMVSAQEARDMLARAKERGEFRFLFPQFDVTKVKGDFVVENRSLSSSSTTMVYLVFRGIEKGAAFYSNLDGKGFASAATDQSNKFVSVSIDNGELRENLSAPTDDIDNLPVGGADWPLAPVYRAKDVGATVSIGDPLFILPTEDFIEQGISQSAGGGSFRERLGDWQVQLFIKKGNDFSLAKMENILRDPKTGKIVMVEITGKG